jgi:transaldolase
VQTNNTNSEEKLILNIFIANISKILKEANKDSYRIITGGFSNRNSISITSEIQTRKRNTIKMF